MTRGWYPRVGVETRGEFVAAFLMLVSYPLMLVAALAASVPGFLIAAALSYVSDHYIHRRESRLLGVLTKVRAGISIRFLARQLLLILLLARTEPDGLGLVYVAAVGFVVFYSLQAPHTGLVMLLRRKRRLPIATRNVDLTTLPVPDGAPRGLTHRAAEKVLHTELPFFLGLLIAVYTETVAYAHAGGALTLLLALGYIVVLLPFLRAKKLPPRTEETLEWFNGWLREYQPTVALYFSGTRDAAYQANMWIKTMEKLEGKPVIILRERYVIPQLVTTTVPVICVPSAVHLMNMDLSSLRVGLYPANVGKNLHLLRVPTMKHVFIGHGDSDKIASINPYTKAYDEVWSAGRAGRDRYALADVGVRDEDIVEVGRPQLAAIGSADELPQGRIPTVLYAPTWEGWTDDPGNTSLIHAGERIIKRLLESERPVRVLYKPHPFTGMRSPQAAAAHRRIVANLEAATARRAADPVWRAEKERTAPDRARAQAILRRLEQARAKEVGEDSFGRWDDAAVSRDDLTTREQACAEERQRDEWNDAYWRSFGWWEHRVITGAEPQLYDCFNQSHALISDVSSVVTDFIASGKPYAVTDSAGLGAETFARQNTAVRAAVILSNSAGELDELLDAVFDPALDALRETREGLKTYLLGPAEPTSLERFNRALRTLAEKSEARNQAQSLDSSWTPGATASPV